MWVYLLGNLESNMSWILDLPAQAVACAAQKQISGRKTNETKLTVYVILHIRGRPILLCKANIFI